jgi:hypothetical protein
MQHRVKKGHVLQVKPNTPGGFERLQTIPPGIEHLTVLIDESPGPRCAGTRMFITLRSRQGIPIAYLHLTFLDTALESKFNPLISLGKSDSSGLPGFFNKFYNAIVPVGWDGR